MYQCQIWWAFFCLVGNFNSYFMIWFSPLAFSSMCIFFTINTLRVTRFSRLCTHCCHARPALSPAVGLQSGFAPGCRTPPRGYRSPSVGLAHSVSWGTPSSPRSPTGRSWWGLGCLCPPACRRAGSENGRICSIELQAVRAHQRDRSRRSAVAGAAETVVGALTSECPSRKKAWRTNLWPD